MLPRPPDYSGIRGNGFDHRVIPIFGCSFMKKTFLGLLLTLFASGLAASFNVVFFFIDDMGWTDLGFMGSKYYESPHVDKLAKEGMVFMNAYAAAPTALPVEPA